MIVGIDEAGRGCGAGPVVAAAAVFGEAERSICPDDILNNITDSKKLSFVKREKVFQWLSKNILWGIGESSAQKIDETGIKKSNFLAMETALGQLRKKNNQPIKTVLVDGNDGFVFNGFETISIIKGDEKEICISAASILAKVYRDKKMISYAQQFPDYGFEKHKGYLTALHINNIKAFGVCEIHRKSYQPIPQILFQPTLL